MFNLNHKGTYLSLLSFGITCRTLLFDTHLHMSDIATWTTRRVVRMVLLKWLTARWHILS